MIDDHTFQIFNHT